MASAVDEMFVVAGEERSCARWALGRGEAEGVSVTCPGKETGNEDAGMVVSVGGGGVVLAVADGAGGMPGGAEASRAALGALAGVVMGCGGDMDSLTAGVLRGFDEANGAVMGMRIGAGTTLAVVVVCGGVARAFHAGDSMVVITGQRGRVKERLIAHSPTGYGVESGLMTEDEALAHEERSLVLNLVGFDEMRVEVGPPVTLGARDTVLVASDGLSDNLTESEIVDAVRAGGMGGCLARLEAMAGGRMADGTGHADDLTMVMYRPSVVGG